MSFKSYVKKILGTLKHNHMCKSNRHTINIMSFAITAMLLANKVIAFCCGTKVYIDRYNRQAEK